MKQLTSKTFELSRHRVSLCSVVAGGSVTCGGETFTPDLFNAYVVFELAHGFPVETIDGRGLHPQVVANSFRSLKYKVFDLAHFIKSYNKDVPKDIVLGTILAVELTGQNVTVQPDRAKAPGIRCVAVMHKQLDRVPEILETWDSRKIDWKVSMEQNYPYDPDTGIAPTSGWVVELPTGACVLGTLAPFWDRTPPDLQSLGMVYVPCLEAPAELNALLDPATGAVQGAYRGLKASILFGGLDGQVYFKGAGLCPLGAEPEAAVAQMLAGDHAYADLDGVFVRDVTWPLKKIFKKN